MKHWIVWLVAALIGAVNAAVLFVVEFVGIEVTAWLWNDLFNSDSNRWIVLPLAALLGIVLAYAFERFRVPRLQHPHADLMKDMEESDGTLAGIGVILLIGMLSLLAGASLGPEASLMMASVSIGVYASKRWHVNPLRQTLVLASIGALLVAFFASLIPAAIPLLIMFQQAKKQKRRVSVQSAGVVLAAATVSFVVIHLIRETTSGTTHYSVAPELPTFAPHDYITALILGFVSGFLAYVTVKLIDIFYTRLKRINHKYTKNRPYLFGAAIGVVLGGIYIIGGPTVQFSGKLGSDELLQAGTEYGALALAGLALVKIAAIAWSKAAGYWGGLVFPSVYVGVALGLLVGALLPEYGGAGAMIGGICGMMVAAVGSPILAAILLAALVPFGPLWLVVACAMAGTVAYTRVHARFASFKLS